MKIRTTTAIVGVLAILVSALTLRAEVIYSESFDYGTTSGVDLETVSNWDTPSTGDPRYSSSGLDVAGMSNETGGRMINGGDNSRSRDTDYDFTIGNTPSAAVPMSDLAVGDSLWLAAIFDYKIDGYGEGVTGVNYGFSLQVKGGYSTMGAAIDPSGDVFVATTNTSTSQDTGISVVTGTYLMLFKYTKGAADGSGSSVDLWIDPANTSSEGSLGTADYTNNSITWGSDSDSLTQVLADLTVNGSGFDEIRLATELSEAITNVTIPEPSTLILALLGLTGMLVRRRRK